MKKFVKGFTLIELLIVITIIGILAVAFLPQILDAPVKARDAKRVADLQNIAQAIAYGQLNSETIPATTGCLKNAGFGTKTLANMGGAVPTDPSNAAPPTINGATCAATNLGQYVYVKGPTNYSFGIYAKMEQTNSGNATCSDLGTLNTDVDPSGNKDCYAMLVQ